MTEKQTETENQFDNVKTILCVGAGGISSYLAELIADLVKSNQFPDDVQWTFVDFDEVEMKNVLYQNFSEEEVGTLKCEALAVRYEPFIFAENKKIESEADLEHYDMIVLGVDNAETRKLVYEHCHKTGKPFLDGRAEGSTVALYSDYEGWDLNELIGTLNFENGNTSCQLGFMLDNQEIDVGNRIIAPIMAQVLLNRFRGLSYAKKLNISI